jgi:hypothetical protein
VIDGQERWQKHVGVVVVVVVVVIIIIIIIIIAIVIVIFIVIITITSYSLIDLFSPEVLLQSCNVKTTYRGHCCE